VLAIESSSLQPGNARVKMASGGVYLLDAEQSSTTKIDSRGRSRALLLARTDS